MGLSSTIYQTIFKRNSVFVGSIFFGAFAFGLGFDTATNKLWENHNKGKLWADIRDKVGGSEEE
ncbi:ubiquinol-cytochrome C reductase [Jaminaea rosea]|uniref:Complex III subunit 9 n=1 Tax=Jaminaea rosea TaxID=1569628 RepID=A0A316UPZ3_9BASI|nr:ubiquinol-cytochrome C reductase [Jaminaea rosea]PWN25943.1 ubiquinol-cytochrome C reductase [Jaminaea rosea]